MPTLRKSLAALLILLIAGLQAGFGAIPVVVAKQKLRWRQGKVRLAVSRSLTLPNSNIKTGSDVAGAILRSVDAWRAVADIDIVVEDSLIESASPAGIDGDGVSVITSAATPENVLMFGKTDDQLSAKTRVFYNRRGLITEGDIVLNPFQQFSTDGTYGTFDLETAIKHEIGHLLGLGHSNVVGSLMYDSTARNGVFGSPETISREVASDDVSAIRDLYGAANADACCGVISGKIIRSFRSVRSIDIWAENAETGDVAASATASRDGTFRMAGMSDGSYRLFLRSSSGNADNSIVEIGEVSVKAGETRQITRKLSRQPLELALYALGLNGTLGDTNLRLLPGRTYTVYVGGNGFSAESVRFETGGRSISIAADSAANVDYGNGLSAVSIQVTVDAGAMPGSYSVCGVDRDGSKDCIVGGLTVISPPDRVPDEPFDK